MAGHSKWANIQHRKSAQDARRGKLFTRLIREVTMAARTGGADPASNPRLRAAIDAALSSNMTRDTIERAVKRATGGDDISNLEEVRYEGYGPGGAAVMVDCMTDNRNRTVGEVRHAFTKCGGNLGSDGSVAYLFAKCGVLNYPRGTPEERVLEAALEAGAQDVVNHADGGIEVIADAEKLAQVKGAMNAAGLAPESAEVTLRASISMRIDGDDAARMVRLIEMLEDLDDVQKVYSNADISGETLARLTA